MSEDGFGQRKIHRLEHGGPVNGVGGEDIFSDKFAGGGPPAVEFFIIGTVADAGDIVEQGIEPDVGDIIFIEGQSSLTEDGNPHPRGLSACILIGADPDAVVVGHRPNHPYREPRGIDYEVKAIEAVVPTTKVVGLSINLRNADEDMTLESFEEKYGLPAADMYSGGAAKILDAILEYLDKN